MFAARLLRAPCLIPTLVVVACATAETVSPPDVGGGGSGGADLETGGASSGGASSGGKSSGGASSSGGATAKGGASSSGGATAKGGATGKAGASSSSGGAFDDTKLPYSENFETPVGQRWIVSSDAPGPWAVKPQGGSNAYVVDATDMKTFAIGGSYTWTNVRVESKVEFVSTGGNPVAYLMARWSDPKNYIVLEFRPGDSSNPEGDLKLRHNENGSTADVCRYKPGSAPRGDWLTFGFSVKGGSGSTVTLLYNGAAVTADKPCTLSRANPPSGGIALGADGGIIAFDDVSVKLP